jgi:acetoacetyl-CoA synthetase
LPNTPHANSIERLTAIWQRVLQRPDVTPSSNFFDLGGDPQKVYQLIDEIVRIFGRPVPVLRLCQAPTITELAKFLETAEPPPIPPVMQLMGGIGRPPVFIMHGLGGSVLEFMQLVRLVDVPNPFYGFQAKGADGSEEPLDRVEDMAQYHLEALRHVQPQGPYFLLGFSLGGLVVYEMARQLDSNGERVSLLVLIESYPDLTRVSLRQRLRVRARVAKYHANSMLRMPFPKAISYLIHPDERQRCDSSQCKEKNGVAPPELSAIAPGMPRVREAALLALQRYQPPLYGGPVKFVKAATSLYFPDNPRAFWAPLVDRFDEETVPGDHLGILNVHFAELATVLSRYLRAADAIQ